MITRFSAPSRLLAALVAASFGSVGAVVQVLLGMPIEATNPVSLIVPLAAPVGAVLGFRHGTTVVRAPSFPLKVVAIASLQAVVLGVVALASVIALSGTYSPRPATIGEFVPLFVVIVAYGIVLFGLPMYLIAAVVAAASALICRRLAAPTAGVHGPGAGNRASLVADSSGASPGRHGLAR